MHQILNFTDREPFGCGNVRLHLDLSCDIDRRRQSTKHITHLLRPPRIVHIFV